MPKPNFTILYVDDPLASARFYAGLLGDEPIDTSPTFAMFQLESGQLIGLWARHAVEPAAGAAVGGGEVGFMVDDEATVEATHSAWAGRGVTILQEPTTMDFGRTFTAQDPDGHRLRVFSSVS
jgi:catechol 2,3-dioxygenase-like lactoylglutathione lyase family enzyme